MHLSGLGMKKKTDTVCGCFCRAHSALTSEESLFDEVLIGMHLQAPVIGHWLFIAASCASSLLSFFRDCKDLRTGILRWASNPLTSTKLTQQIISLNGPSQHPPFLVFKKLFLVSIPLAFNKTRIWDCPSLSANCQRHDSRFHQWNPPCGQALSVVNMTEVRISRYKCQTKKLRLIPWLKPLSGWCQDEQVWGLAMVFLWNRYIWVWAGAYSKTFACSCNLDITDTSIAFSVLSVISGFITPEPAFSFQCIMNRPNQPRYCCVIQDFTMQFTFTKHSPHRRNTVACCFW